VFPELFWTIEFWGPFWGTFNGTRVIREFLPPKEGRKQTHRGSYFPTILKGQLGESTAAKGFSTPRAFWGIPQGTKTSNSLGSINWAPQGYWHLGLTSPSPLGPRYYHGFLGRLKKPFHSSPIYGPTRGVLTLTIVWDPGLYHTCGSAFPGLGGLFIPQAQSVRGLWSHTKRGGAAGHTLRRLYREDTQRLCLGALPFFLLSFLPLKSESKNRPNERKTSGKTSCSTQGGWSQCAHKWPKN